MKKKTLLMWVLITVLAIGTLVSCAPKQEPPAPEEPAATEESTAPAPAPEPAAPAEQPAAEQPAAGGEITVDKAKEIALADAKVDVANAVFKSANLDFDDGVQMFEVEFYANDTEYSYDIDAASGNILSREAEAMDAEDYQEMEALR
jgi:hypothetical protein